MKTMDLFHHAGFRNWKEYVRGWLEAKGWALRTSGPTQPRVATIPTLHPLALAVEAGECYPELPSAEAVEGISITLNKHQGIRAAPAGRQK